MVENVRIRIRATVTDLVLAERYRESAQDGFFVSDEGKTLPIEAVAEASSQVISYAVDGVCAEDKGTVTIRYREPSEMGYDNCITTLIFDSQKRDVLTMVRSGDVATAFRFDLEERRQKCSYETPIMPIEFTVNTRSVKNTVTEGSGAILLDYFLEMRGVNTERNRLWIEVQVL